MPRLIRDLPAEYQDLQAPAAYVGNPLIEALPRIFSEDEVGQNLRHFPKTASEVERVLPPHERIHCVSAVDDLVVPLPIAFDVEAALSVMIRRGYAARNPFNLCLTPYLVHISPAIPFQEPGGNHRNGRYRRSLASQNRAV